MQPQACAMRCAVIAFIVLSTLACSRTNVEIAEPESRPLTKGKCVLQRMTTQYPGALPQIIYQKTYDASGKRVVNLHAGLYSGGGIASTVKLDVKYTDNTIYLLSAENVQDTGLVLQLDKGGRVQKVHAGPIIDFGFGPQEFFYEKGRLNLINIDNNWLRIWFRYDQWGNLTELVTDSTNGEPRTRHVYEYNHNQKAMHQFYQDEVRGFSLDVLTMMHQLGFLPELDPVHARTRSTVRWSSYLAYDYDIINHVFDNTRLISYQTRQHTFGYTGSNYFLSWDCGKKDNNPIALAR